MREHNLSDLGAIVVFKRAAPQPNEAGSFYLEPAIITFVRPDSVDLWVIGQCDQRAEMRVKQGDDVGQWRWRAGAS